MLHIYFVCLYVSTLLDREPGGAQALSPCPRGIALRLVYCGYPAQPCVFTDMTS